MKIATWNVAKPVVSMRSKRLDRIIEAIKAEQADIWVLTETHPEVVPGAGYCSVPTADLFSGEKWVMIWSQYPIENIPIQSCDSLSVAALVKPPNRTPMIVCGVVLPWVGSKWNGSPWQKGKAFTEALNEQAQEWQRLKAAYPNYDFVVAGDFNQDLGAKHFYGSTHNKKFLDDTLNNLQLNCLTRGDIDPVQAQTCGKWQSIDHICVNSRLAGMARLPGVSWPQGLKPDNSLSDHFGTAVAFE